MEIVSRREKYRDSDQLLPLARVTGSYPLRPPHSGDQVNDNFTGLSSSTTPPS